MDYKQVAEAFKDKPIEAGLARRIADALPVAAVVNIRPSQPDEGGGAG